MTLPTMLAQGREEVLGWCRAVDEGPWADLAVPERVTYPSHSLTVQLAAAAALTERVRLWTTIVILPAHNAVQAAKDLASVDQLCAGRLTVGVGVGGREDDYRAIGAPFDRRWQRMDAQVAEMRRIWAGEPPFPGADPVGPPPVQPGGPPFIAGVMGPKALARAARWAAGVDDGSTVAAVNGDALAAVVARVRAAWRDAGRVGAAPRVEQPLVRPRTRGGGTCPSLRLRLSQDLRRGDGVRVVKHRASRRRRKRCAPRSRRPGRRAWTPCSWCRRRRT